MRMQGHRASVPPGLLSFILPFSLRVRAASTSRCRVEVGKARLTCFATLAVLFGGCASARPAAPAAASIAATAGTPAGERSTSLPSPLPQGPPCPASGGQIVATVQYSPGWHLVGLPLGACLHGEAQPVYTITPAGELVPRPAQGSGPLPLWVYFPGGGGADLVQAQPMQPLASGCGSTTFGPQYTGQWEAVVNQWPTPARVVRGASDLTLYTPEAGYAASTTIPPGESGLVIVGDTGTVQLCAGDSN